jgi:D-tyrosyl-tRNA(Tyr) deacylase
MLSRAQEAQVREILGSHPPGNVLAYCLEHLAATAQIPPAHLADLRGLRQETPAVRGLPDRLRRYL